MFKKNQKRIKNAQKNQKIIEIRQKRFKTAIAEAVLKIWPFEKCGGLHPERRGKKV